MISTITPAMRQVEEQPVHWSELPDAPDRCPPTDHEDFQWCGCASYPCACDRDHDEDRDDRSDGANDDCGLDDLEDEMTPEQDRIARRFERLVRDARNAGLVVVADSGAIAIRLIPVDEQRAGAADIRELGTTVPVDDACGSSSKVNGDVCCYGVS